MSGKLGWDGGPNAPDLSTLNGTVAVDLEHGQILRIKPGTAEAAKLLSVLSLQSLVHFLTLDFHDVAGKGLPFEKVTGTGVVRDGIGSTDDFTMVTPPARIEMKGQVDLPQKTQDLHVRVIPTISAGAVAIGAAVINPLLGLGVLAGDLLLSKSIGVAFTKDFSVTGPWSKPVVQRTKHDQGKIETPVSAAAAAPPPPRRKLLFPPGRTERRCRFRGFGWGWRISGARGAPGSEPFSERALR